MRYNEVLEYLYAQLPMFQRIGAAAYKADLRNIQTLCDILQHPEHQLKYIHIAGTNGKGSVSNMLAAIFQTNGYRTGLFTSPHLIDFRERIRVNGKMISKQYIISFFKKYQQAFEVIHPSFFEWSTALAFQYFYDKQVDIVILETGMGGRLDSTNVITPELSIITNIGDDHKQFLGDTYQKIAYEKAGIIKPFKMALISEYQEDVKDVFEEVAHSKNAPLIYAKDVVEIVHSSPTNRYLDISYYIYSKYLKNFLDKSNNLYNNNQNYLLDNYNKKFLINQIKKLDKSKNKIYSLQSALIGEYQVKNIRCVLAAAEIMRLQGWKLKRYLIHHAIKHTPNVTGFHGRWEIIHNNPYIILDIAHNKQGIKSALENLKYYQIQQLRIIFGVVSDKEVDDILSLLPKDAVYYFTQASVPRAMPVKELFDKAKKRHLIGNTYDKVEDALYQAWKDAHNNDMILVFGSAFVVADALAYWYSKH